MSIKVQCSCGQAFQAKDELAGKRVKCPKCGGALQIPSPQTPAVGDFQNLGLGQLLADAQRQAPTAAQQSQGMPTGFSQFQGTVTPYQMGAAPTGGAPVLNAKGEVVGMYAANVSDKYGQAIAAARLKELIATAVGK